jgi:hypothetical protein
VKKKYKNTKIQKYKNTKIQKYKKCFEILDLRVEINYQDTIMSSHHEYLSTELKIFYPYIDELLHLQLLIWPIKLKKLTPPHSTTHPYHPTFRHQ